MFSSINNVKLYHEKRQVLILWLTLSCLLSEKLNPSSSVLAVLIGSFEVLMNKVQLERPYGFKVK